MNYARIAAIALALMPDFAAAQNRITVTFDPIDLNASIDGPLNATGQVLINGFTPENAPANVKFKYAGVAQCDACGGTSNTVPNFLVVSPASATTSPDGPSISQAQVLVGINPVVVQHMTPGKYPLFLTFSTVDQTPPVEAGIQVTLHLAPPPAPTITSIVNSASLQPTLSPGALVSIFGTNIATPLGVLHYNDTGAYPTTLGDGTASNDTTITFSGTPAPLLYVSPTQVNAVVPFEVAGQKSASVVLTRFGQTATFTVPIQDTSPAIFTATQTGSGQGAILNGGSIYSTASATYNGPDNPAAPGSVVTMYATGAGVWTQPLADGSISLTVSNFRCAPGVEPQCWEPAAKPISATIGGLPASVSYPGYVGSYPYQLWSILQITAVVPAGVASGQQPVVLTIGHYDNSKQNVTVAIQ